MAFLTKDASLIEGVLKCPGSIRIDGVFHANIHADGDVYVGKNAAIKGLIKAANLYVYGSVHGDVLCKNKVHIYQHAKISGEIITKLFEIEEGGSFEGKFTMRR